MRSRPYNHSTPVGSLATPRPGLCRWTRCDCPSAMIPCDQNAYICVRVMLPGDATRNIRSLMLLKCYLISLISLQGELHGFAMDCIAWNCMELFPLQSDTDLESFQAGLLKIVSDVASQAVKEAVEEDARLTPEARQSLLIQVLVQCTCFADAKNAKG